MAYTQTDLDNLIDAKMALDLGTAKVQVSISGKSITYHQRDRAGLESAIISVQRALGQVKARTYGYQGGRAS